ncbi:MAG: sulfite exporter TauE/SafE family protein [candidate division KSB1 bacterium]|nr:sulfite exporter TauE/SafE family protein [candidate division KSB1 bacterium]MDZ7304059.1 sulfite exporter TauE/SafE family protein [candidate division KSB1 bacterium]MDZ7313230.1 sulfite exporter TauE/SafE family protein [candidate division KSB1 bacterium]
MSNEILLLSATALSLGFIHTILGPDHYLPFILMARAGKWSMRKTVLITCLSGMGHVLSSVLLGMIGIAAGITLSHLEAIEAWRGDLAAWLLIGFGIAYAIWGLRRAYRQRSHTHWHVHGEGTAHAHQHTHEREHLHVHQAEEARITPWVVFTIFVFGPCEVLIPLLMYPAAQQSWWGLLIVTMVFGLTTISTMLVIVLTAKAGIARLPFGPLEKYSHAIAGATIALCGIAIRFLGL